MTLISLERVLKFDTFMSWWRPDRCTWLVVASQVASVVFAVRRPVAWVRRDSVGDQEGH